MGYLPCSLDSRVDVVSFREDCKGSFLRNVRRASNIEDSLGNLPRHMSRRAANVFSRVSIKNIEIERCTEESKEEMWVNIGS